MNKVESSRHSGNYPNEKVMKEFQVKMNNYGQKTPEIKEKVFTLMKNTISWGLGKQSDEAVGALGTQSQYHESKALTYQALNRIKEICPNIKEP